MSLTPPIPSLEVLTQELLDHLPANFPARNPDAFSTFGTYIRLAAQVGLDVWSSIEALAPQLLVTRATGAWLDAHAKGLGLQRKSARAAILRCRVQASASGSFPPGAVFGTSNLRYFLEGSFAPNTQVEARSEGLGSQYNLPPGTLLYPITVVPGVEYLDVLEILQPGEDEEADDELRQRCILTWPAQGLGGTRHAYVLWALEDTEIRKVRVRDDHPRGEGTVDVIIAPSSGLPSSAAIARVQQTVNERKPLTVDALVRAPDTISLNITATFYLKPEADPLSEWASRMALFVNGLGIGEAFYPSRLADFLHNYPGLQAVELVNPNAPQFCDPDEMFMPGTMQALSP